MEPGDDLIKLKALPLNDDFVNVLPARHFRSIPIIDMDSVGHIGNISTQRFEFTSTDPASF